MVYVNMWFMQWILRTNLTNKHRQQTKQTKWNNLCETNPNDENVVSRTQFLSKGRSGRVRIWTSDGCGADLHWIKGRLLLLPHLCWDSATLRILCTWDFSYWVFWLDLPYFFRGYFPCECISVDWRDFRVLTCHSFWPIFGRCCALQRVLSTWCGHSIFLCGALAASPTPRCHRLQLAASVRGMMHQVNMQGQIQWVLIYYYAFELQNMLFPVTWRCHGRDNS